MKKILLLLFFCSCVNNQLNIPQEDFIPTWKQPYTNQLKHYQHALSYWTNNLNLEKAIVHFPRTFNTNNSYEFVFIPHILQGSSIIGLKITFKDRSKAKSFFKNASERKEFKEYNNINNRNLSCLIQNLNFGIDSNDKDNITVRCFNGDRCLSNDARRYISNILLLDKTVILWADENDV